ncbi:protein NRDE2 homolog isoform X2 [Phalaenopsis equestris]|uniref:protein NRDE2 homolog isoform X2 n=1 Tax=Phalaenopsis equestris TaxID=78828 RepID=UPI0009E578C5|nr:protein NRDE2 homolog isoform X2 [Phalaenopsis equestris]
MDAPDTASMEAIEKERAQEVKKERAQLFPLLLSSDHPPAFTENSEPAKWLSNPSFTFDVSAVPAVIPAPFPITSPLENSDEEDAEAPKKPSYEPVPLPSSSESERPSERKEKGRRRKRKREKGRESLGQESSRKSGVRAWIGSETKPSKDYYFDVHGDRDNLAFGCLYRMDIARYKLQYHSDLSEFDFELLCHRRYSVSSMDIDHDLDVLDTKLKGGGRYYSVKFTTLERHKGFKHVKIAVKKSSLIPGEYIPLVELRTSTENGRNELNADVELEESWEDELLRRTRELNKMSRDFPHDEKVWLAFAEFQDKVANTQPQKSARLQTLEKKISILEKAVELNPDNEELLLCLLKSYQQRETTDSLMEKWEKVIVRHFDSVMLWKEFLFVRHGEYSKFKVSDVRKTYGHAIQALSSACNNLCRQDYKGYNLKSNRSSLVPLELGLVDIFINLCRFEWQTGHRELATGLFQAEIEYSLFCPSLLLSSHSKQKLFEHFWNSNGARFGEDGALGWSTWLEKEEETKKEAISEEMVEESEGGWSGWSDAFSNEPAAKKEISEEHLDVDNTEDNPDNEFIPLSDDVETLLKKLGIDVDADPHTEIKDTMTWKKWSQEELSRDSVQWMPIRENSGNCGSFTSAYLEYDMDRNEQLSRVILFEDVNQYLFSLCSNEARYSLVSQFVEFFGAKISRWTCTNNASWMEKVLSLETLEDSISEDLRVISNVCASVEHPVPSVLESLLGSNTDIFRSTSTVMFLRNAILLCLSVFPRNHILEDALITVEELVFNQKSTSSSSIKPSRALAKSLLKKDRQDLLLCGVYARSEAAYGNIDVARKIFDMALSSANGLPKELTEHIPILYIWYAEMEMAACKSSSSGGEFVQRALHILSCLGGNLKYSPFTTKTSGLDILRARQGFKEQVKNLRSAWAHGDVKESSVALIRTASLFEVLTTGCSAGIQIMEEAFSMALPERRSHNLQLESLWMHYLATLQQYVKQLKFPKVWEVVTQSLRMYPYNPKSYSTLVQVSSFFTARHKIRQLFDEYMQRKPSVIVWLSALAFELGKQGAEHRVHGLFEKALANDKLQKSALLWRCYLAYETDIACNPSAARRTFFRAIHACPWSKRLWLDGFQKLSSVMSAKELSDLQEVMRDKEIHLRTDIYEILLQDDMGV